MTAPSSYDRTRRLWLPGIAVAILGLALSLWLARQQQMSSEALAQIRFTEEVRASSSAIAQRLEAYTEVVTGLRDLFLLKPDLSRQEFERIVAERNLQHRYPEIKNLSFARWVPAQRLEAFEQRRRAQTPAGQAFEPVHPAAERADYYVNEYVWPVDGNTGVLGLDIASQPENLVSLLKARGTGRPALSAPLELVQEKELRTGVILRVPVFKGAEAVNLADDFIGTTAATIRIIDMVRALRAGGFLRGIVVRLDDMGAVGDPAAAPRALASPPNWAAEADLPEVRELQSHGRRWRLSFRPIGSGLSATEQFAPWWIACMGSVLTLLLATLITVLMRQRAQALDAVHVSNQALQQSEESLSAIFNQAAVGIAHVHTPTGRPVRLNERYCAILGYTADELCGMSFMDVTHAADLSDDLEQLQRLKAGEISEYRLEKRVIRKDGQEIWVDLTVSPLWRPGQDCLYHIAIVQDITERRHMQDSLRDSERYLRSILEHLPVGLSIVREDGHFSFSNACNVQICGYAFEEVPDTQSWWRLAYPDPQLRERTRKNWLAACERARQGDGRIAAGEYEIRCKNGQVRLVEIAGMMLGDSYLVTMVDLSQRKAAEDKIRYLAYYDALTQLPNRRLLRDHLQQTLQAHAQSLACGALLLLDIDNFKTLNDTRGHDKGDALLCQVAQRLRGSLPSQHMVARLGGDEFVVVLSELANSHAQAEVLAQSMGQQILAALREPYVLDGETLHFTASIGIAVFEGKGERISELLKQADLAMYQAKAVGRDSLELYDPDIQAVVRSRAELGLDMRVGLVQGQFELFYQPQVEGNRITGCEALLRWHHPRNGSISPAVFIPLAEETGLILALGEWVLQAACRQLALWAQDPMLARLTLAVNVSPRQFRQSGFVTQVLAALASTGAEPRRLKLEITEGLLLDNVEDIIRKMSDLKAYGVGFALDDFGTGYSSLAYLKRLPLDQLKIDQSFVRDVLTDPNDAAIARTIMALGTSLGLHVMAEGVETEEQRQFLQNHNCHAWQGYLLSPPVPADRFRSLAHAHEACLQ